MRIQREFLWGGVRGGRKINWVRWKLVCQTKNNGGLGVCDVRILNVSLLAKWKWRLVDEEEVLWKDVLVEKYVLRQNPLILKITNLDDERINAL